MTQKRSYQNQNGFTLVELSIVLVIIGLIVGGVLVGQDMIRAAESRAIVAQIEKYNTAINTFRNKYNALPGDITNPTTYISTSAATGGDGNGYIYSAAGTPSTTPTAINGSGNELSTFWNHLSLAGFIDGNFDGSTTQTTLGTNFPYTKSGRGGIIIYASSDGLHYWHIGLASATASTTITTVNSLRPEEAFNIDTKVDDGRPNNGIILARGGVVLEGSASSGSGAGSYCTTASTSAGIYNLLNIAPLCQLRIRVN